MIKKVLYRVSETGIPVSIVFLDDLREFYIQYFSRRVGPMYRVFRSNFFSGNLDKSKKKLFDVYLSPGKIFDLEEELYKRNVWS